MPFDPLDHLDASLADFEHPSRPSTHSPVPTRHHLPGFPFGYPSTHLPPNNNSRNNTASTTSSRCFLKSDTDEGTTITTASDLLTMASSTASAGGYSPPAWRRLGNGDRSSGFWRKGGDNLLGYGGLPPNGFGKPRDFDAEYDSTEDLEDMVDDEDILAAAIRTRLPTGSMSPEKERSPEPEYARHHQVPNNNNNSTNNNNNKPKSNANGNGHIQPDHDFRIKSEEPSAEDMKATLAAIPSKDDSDNCKSTLPYLHPSPCGLYVLQDKVARISTNRTKRRKKYAHFKKMVG